ncbi:MAG: beta-ketoacyl synthase N-terminal-like domain-containing protein, partial [Planctomycetota bacterium]
MSSGPIDKASFAPIAIIGMACRFPGANNLEEFWTTLLEGERRISAPPTRISRGSVPAEIWAEDEEMPPGGFFEAVDSFDHEFFGICQADALVMPPQHRMFLETCYHALEDARIPMGSIRGTESAVYAALSPNEYSQRRSMTAGYFNAFALGATDQAMGANRVSKFFGISGPSMNLDAACASSAIATDLACQYLQNNSGVAFAGGANIITSLFGHALLSRSWMMSADGHCRSFDKEASGYVRGEGCAVLILKQLDAAVRDGDYVRAVIRSSCVANSGDKKETSQSQPTGLALAMNRAYKLGQIDPMRINYIEGHGVATPAADETELESINQIFAPARPDTNSAKRWLGSLKPNFGHTEWTAGAASLIKSALIVERGIIPPNIDFEEPHDLLEDSDFSVPTKREHCTDKSLLAGVNSFGIGGTSAHIVLESPPTQTSPARTSHVSKRNCTVVPLSAQSQESLNQLSESLSRTSADRMETNAIAAQFAFGRTSFPLRRATVLPAESQQSDPPIETDAVQRPIIFLFTGQGSQYPRMSEELSACSPTFQAAFNECVDRFQELLGYSIHEVLKESVATVSETLYAQPAIFSFEYAMAKTWLALGVQPTASIGH